MNAMSETPEKLSTLKEMIARFKVSEKTVRRWVASGQIEAIYAGRQLRFEEREIKRFMDSRRRARDRQQPRTKRTYRKAS
jgi:excisionase family DNA binding protein